MTGKEIGVKSRRELAWEWSADAHALYHVDLGPVLKKLFCGKRAELVPERELEEVP